MLIQTKQVLPLSLVRCYFATECNELVILYSSDRCHRWIDRSNHYLSVSSDSYYTHHRSDINKCVFFLICVQHFLLS